MWGDGKIRRMDEGRIAAEVGDEGARRRTRPAEVPAHSVWEEDAAVVRTSEGRRGRGGRGGERLKGRGVCEGMAGGGERLLRSRSHELLTEGREKEMKERGWVNRFRRYLVEGESGRHRKPDRNRLVVAI